MGELDRVLQRVSLLILVLLLLGYATGTTNIIGALGQTFGNLITILQGRSGTPGGAFAQPAHYG